jgi:hypothetical protein
LIVENEDVYTNHDEDVDAKLTNPYQDRVDKARSLFGILPNDITMEEAREEKLSKI